MFVRYVIKSILHISKQKDALMTVKTMLMWKNLYVILKKYTVTRSTALSENAQAANTAMVRTYFADCPLKATGEKREGCAAYIPAHDLHSVCSRYNYLQKIGQLPQY